MVILSLDQAVRSSGWAIYVDDVLSWCGVVKNPRTEHKSLSDGEDAAKMVSQIVTALPIDSIDLVVYEWPQVYGKSDRAVDPNDLLTLAAIGAGVAGSFPQAKVKSPRPRVWSGGQSKATKGDPWRSPRGHRVKLALTKKELALVPDSHDAIDAVAIGLWALGRFKPMRVFPGAT